MDGATSPKNYTGTNTPYGIIRRILAFTTAN